MEKEQESQQKIPEVEITDSIGIGLESKVVLYNDDWHSFDDVILQLIKAIHCSFEKARAHAFEVHVKGKSIVFTGGMKDCLKISGILEEIALTTEIIT